MYIATATGGNGAAGKAKRTGFAGRSVFGGDQYRHTLLLADNDAVHITNLQWQILYRTTDLGQSKTELTQRELTALNPDGR